jgi:hypothetical protein
LKRLNNLAMMFAELLCSISLKNRALTATFFLLLLNCLDCQKAFAIEPGVYSDFSGVINAKPRKLLAEIGMLDQVLDFHGPDEIRIPSVKPLTKILGEIEVEVIDERRHKQIYLNQNRVEKVLKDKHPKNLLFVWFDKWMMMEPNRAVASLQPFFRRLGYRRVVVVGTCGVGVIVIQDTTYSDATSKN